MPVVQLDGPPAWLQVVHGSNVSNRVRGRIVSPNRTRLTSERCSTTRDAYRENLHRMCYSTSPRRAGDGARSAARFVGLKLLGKERPTGEASFPNWGVAPAGRSRIGAIQFMKTDREMSVRDQLPAHNAEDDMTSVVIAAHNEASVIGRCLDALIRQDSGEEPRHYGCREWLHRCDG